ncbi:phosphotransferase family protein [Qipengyuania aurantiaca]|uniref:Phosphotransferase family protein n=2 Tax=Qipengyuania aurantiaca TaxID=2867233 RepID=A0ABX8ZSS4_9SPHN|nr:phosphotransferase [Qipengyuania aurantiaca]QZD91159.1 phosphotransferase family protein [Qipengyuania aurantiaca]
MGESEGESLLHEGLTRALRRAGIGAPAELQRLTGGATMESWRFEAEGMAYVLRRAPSLAFMEERPFGHDSEAALIRAARDAGVTAPEVVVELDESDGIGSGFVMRALPGTPDPRAILAMEQPEVILAEAARDLARIHSLAPAALAADVPMLDYREGVEKLREQFEEAGGDRPIIALGLRWLLDNLPEPVEPVLNHGDFRLGNLLAEDSHLTGVLDWELAHFGDWHEDLAFGCMPVWRFGAYDRPALGLGSLENYFTAYEAAGGRTVDPARFSFWTIYRTVWWALGCLKNARVWREGQDRMLERVVISRRTSEQEVDLLLLLEEDAPTDCTVRQLWEPQPRPDEDTGDASMEEILIAVSEWLASMKDRVEGHDRFQLAVAINALGIAIRDDRYLPHLHANKRMAQDIISGAKRLDQHGVIGRLRQAALEKVTVDSPKYPSLQVALDRWTIPKVQN